MTVVDKTPVFQLSEWFTNDIATEEPVDKPTEIIVLEFSAKIETLEKHKRLIRESRNKVKKGDFNESPFIIYRS